MGVGKVRLGILYLFPITIGSADVGRYLPIENLRLMKEVKNYVVENARTARQYIKKVLPDVNISELTIYEADKHRGYAYAREEVLQKLLAGEDVGVMSEAGCPGVADPGSRVVAECHGAGIRVVPLVGPSSILLSLMASGFSGQNFAFHGYISHDRSMRKKTLLEWQRRVQERGETQIFIEAPYRNDKLIAELCEVLSPNTMLSVAVDLTTPQEEIKRYRLKQWQEQLKRGVTYHKRTAIFLLGKED